MLANSLLMRRAVVAAVGIFGVLTLWLNLDRVQSTTIYNSVSTTIHSPSDNTNTHNGHLPIPVARFFDQMFSAQAPKSYDFPALREYCDHMPPRPEVENVYMECEKLFAGMTSIMSEMKSCLKMAVEAGTGIILPTIPLRDSQNLLEFNQKNEDAHMVYDKWFDAQHLIDSLAKACPKMKVLHPNQLKPYGADRVQVKHHWEIDILKAPGYKQYSSYFWAGRPFKTFFDSQLAELQKKAGPKVPGEGISVIKISAIFLLYRITDDPTGTDLKLWNDVTLLMRFLEKPRQVIGQLTSQMNRPYYGVHFRVENDTIWSSLENQLAHDLDALDAAWAKFGKSKETINGAEKPLVYLACGDEEQVKKFQEAGKARGWEVTHKWDLAKKSSDPGTLKVINDLPFDFQGAIDMGMMIQSHFFIGIDGSAFSYSVASARDITGKYRGSSLEVYDDHGARTHLNNDGTATGYPCCL